jgi:hypothetical protein
MISSTSLILQIHHDVRPDSLLILHAAHEVVEEDGFNELLDSVRDRIDEIESLHRTRELTVSACVLVGEHTKLCLDCSSRTSMQVSRLA